MCNKRKARHSSSTAGMTHRPPKRHPSHSSHPSHPSHPPRARHPRHPSFTSRHRDERVPPRPGSSSKALVSHASHYLLSYEERVQNEYPLDYRKERGRDGDDRWVSTHAAHDKKHGSAPLEMIGLDCEMVMTSAGSELARLTAVDATHTVLLDTLVKPERPVLDYKTPFSGITEEQLRIVTTTLVQARAQLLHLITADTVLVGHSLENDLRALKLQHDRVIDTSVVYPRAPGPPVKHSLRFLARRLLRRVIQSGDAGHDSAEDARAALALAQMKIARGPRFGFAYMADDPLPPHLA